MGAGGGVLPPFGGRRGFGGAAAFAVAAGSGSGGMSGRAGSNSAGAAAGNAGAAAGNAGATGTCGDGRLDPGETCDNGSTNGSLGTSCSAKCRINVRELSAGNSLSCALGYNGALKCWGFGGNGALGQGSPANIGDQPGEMGSALAPIDLENDLNVFAVAAGETHTCMASLGGVRCWGFNAHGALGLGDIVNRGDAPGEMGSALPWVDLGWNFFPTAIATGSWSSCAVSTYATLKCWGLNGSGQLGLGDTSDRGDSPGEMGDALPFVALGGGTQVKSVSLGSNHACALLADGTIKCWGANDSGQLGLGDTQTRGDEPNEMADQLSFVDLGGEAATKVVAAGDRTCALLANATLKCWGDNSTGGLGLGDKLNRGDQPRQMGAALPALDFGTERQVVDFALGRAHGCAALDDATLKCCGSNEAGQLGAPGALDRGGNSGDMGNHLPVTDIGGAVELLAVGAEHTCVKLRAGGVVKCWGFNPFGELGLGDTQTRGDQPDEMGANLPPVDVDF